MPTKTTAHSSLLELFGSHSARVFMSGKVVILAPPQSTLHTLLFILCVSHLPSGTSNSLRTETMMIYNPHRMQHSTKYHEAYKVFTVSLGVTLVFPSKINVAVYI